MAEFITTNQAAKKLCVSVETVYKMLLYGTYLVGDIVKVQEKQRKLACKCRKHRIV